MRRRSGYHVRKHRRTSKLGTRFEAGRLHSFEREYDKCQTIENKEEKIACLLSLLHRITQLQDEVNLTAIQTLDDDNDPRWLPLHIIDNANGIILNISRNKAHPMVFDVFYVEEKVQSLHSKWRGVYWQYKDE